MRGPPILRSQVATRARHWWCARDKKLTQHDSDAAGYFIPTALAEVRGFDRVAVCILRKKQIRHVREIAFCTARPTKRAHIQSGARNPFAGVGGTYTRFGQCEVDFFFSLSSYPRKQQNAPPAPHRNISLLTGSTQS